MQIKSNVRMLYSRVQTMLRQRRRKQLKPTLEIVSWLSPFSPLILQTCFFLDHVTNRSTQSAPFDLKREPVSLPGVTEDE